MDEGRTLLLLANAGYAVSTVAPILWHGAMGLVYAAAASAELVPSSGGSGVSVVTAALALFAVLKLVAATVLAASAIQAGVACQQAMSGNDALLSRAALAAAAAAGVAELGCVLNCDCVGSLLGVMPLLGGVGAGWLALARAREQRDAARADRG